jgi:Flp pilus assembly CpaF family ATPase
LAYWPPRGGIATIHANSASGVYERMEELCARVTVNIHKQLIRETLDCIVFIQKVVDTDGSVKRKIKEIKTNF